MLLWLLGWISVRDKNVCPDCRDRDKESKDEPLSFNQHQSKGLPGSGCTRCLWRCRCLLLPAELLELFPTLQGEAISAYDDKSLRISKEIDYTRFTKLDKLIREWETVTDDWNLPLDYYNKFDVEERIKLVETIIKAAKKGKIPNLSNFPDEIIPGLLKQNPWILDPSMSATRLK